ncbi:SMP-30/gluconolactonase/LRE family protein [Hahella sp. HN01]|uniref:SMP-30/gluconolactonase/LRE family protein n=1 Tax=Hahella sp. HN01 TaxID=2847262 RepID=UPI001C1EEB44|nr:SMP-30/gluconolactonase/LRE family protein [Hahella sp. HN01]MBU6950229.1 SMP-30/gluconolactonase/LRE family protein [Hahella sp. HN01]
MKASLRLLAVVGVILLTYFLFSPAVIDPEAYDAPSAPDLEGPYAPNQKLLDAELIGQGRLDGPEDVDQDAEGAVYAGLANGDIIRINKDGEFEVLANTGGRPLGIEFNPAGDLIVADAAKGLLQLDKAGKLTVLTSKADNLPFGVADDVDVAKDGVIYFSDASWRWGVHEHRFDLIESRPHGRLLRYDPATGATTVLLDDLYFANGVALSQNEDFVAVCETGRYRVRRYWLQGPKQGTSDMLIENLPGFPDGVSSNGAGEFWIALIAPRNGILDFIHSFPWLKSRMSKLPEALQPQAERYGFVLGMNEQGEVLHNLQDPEGERLHTITSVEQVGDILLFGTLTGDRIGRLSLTRSESESPGL